MAKAALHLRPRAETSLSEKPVLVLFAVKEEARHLSVGASPAHPIRIRVSGMGKDNARACIQQCLQESTPELVLTCGFAGALNPQLRLNQVIFESDHARLDNALLKAGAIKASFICADRVASTAKEKQRLWKTHQADVVEMESSVIRSVCAQSGIPSATVRVISDAANEDLPIDFNQVMTSRQTIDFIKLTSILVRSPGTIARLIAFRKQIVRAGRALGQTLGNVLERLPK